MNSTDVISFVMDPTRSIECRLGCLKQYGSFSSINHLISILNMIHNNTIRTLLYSVCLFERFPIEWRIEVALALIDEEEDMDEINGSDIDIVPRDEKLGVKALSNICLCVMLDTTILDSLNLTRTIDVMLKLYQLGTPIDNVRVRLFMESVMDLDKLNKYNLFRTLNTTPYITLFEPLIKHYLNGENVNPQQALLVCQMAIFSSIVMDSVKLDIVVPFLELTAIHSPNAQCKAEASDILLSHDKDNVVAISTLDSLSIDELKQVRTIYTNRQNIHNTTINQSALDTIASIKQKIVDPTPITESDLITILNRTSINKERVLKAYHRICYLDNALYTIHNLSLKNVMDLIWTFIHSTTFEPHETDELEVRMVEEMDEMYNTCSSGYFVRLVNILSGFQNYGLFIGWDEQIRTNFMVKINGYIKASIDQNLILDDLMKASEGDAMVLKSYQELMVRYLPNIIEEIKLEFNPYLDEHEIDLYLRRAHSIFEGVSFG